MPQNISETDYRQSLAISGTDVARIAKDAESWLFERSLKLKGELPPWLQFEPSSAQAFGTAVHMALLEPERFEREKVVMPYVPSFALKAGKTVKEEAESEAKAKGGFVLKAEESFAIEYIKANFKKAFTDSFIETEKRMFGCIELIECKGTADAFTANLLVDIKTTRDIHNTEEHLYKNFYHLQLAHYHKLANWKKSWAIVWIENVAPYRVKVRVFDDEEIQAALEAHSYQLARSQWSCS